MEQAIVAMVIQCSILYFGLVLFEWRKKPLAKALVSNIWIIPSWIVVSLVIWPIIQPAVYSILDKIGFS